jgi:hypothetical protein
MGGAVPPVGKSALEHVSNLNKEVAELGKEYLEQMEAIKIRSAIGKALQVSAAGNKFLQVLSRPALHCTCELHKWGSVIFHFARTTSAVAGTWRGCVPLYVCIVTCDCVPSHQEPQIVNVCRQWICSVHVCPSAAVSLLVALHHTHLQGVLANLNLVQETMTGACGAQLIG